MASSNITVIVGEPLDWTGFKGRKQRAADAVEKVLGRKVEFDADQATPLTNTACSFDGADPSERLSKKVSDALGTLYHVSIERNLACRTWDMTVQCRSCRVYHRSDFTDEALERVPGLCESHAIKAIALVLIARTGTEIDESKGCFCVDLMTPSQCLTRWTENRHALDTGSGAFTILTAPQIAMARRMWSQQLRAKSRESKERDRNQVLCDLQDEP